MTVPYHSNIGDRGKGDSPNSTDGVVPYWSSHLDGAQSEVIVPGPHGACELPQTIAELDRILRLHLGLSRASRATLAQAALTRHAKICGWWFLLVTVVALARACCCEACTIMLSLSHQDPKRS
jgi:hypothetical protein